MYFSAVSLIMDCGWRIHPLLSAIDFRDKSKTEEQFSCPPSKQIALSVDVSVADLNVLCRVSSIVMVQSFPFFPFLFDLGLLEEKLL